MDPLIQDQLETADTSVWVEMRKAYENLRTNKDFQTLIINGYCNAHALGRVSLLGHPSIQQQNQRSSVMEDLIAISNFNFFLITVDQLGRIPSEEDEEDGVDNENADNGNIE